jgi:hypothetical protein
MTTSRRVLLPVLLVLLAAAAPGAHAGPAPKAGGTCKKAGATTGGGPGVTLRCQRVRGRLVWRKVATQRPAATPQGSGPAAAACSSPGGRPRFTAPFTDAGGVRLITLGRETNDPRFVYVWLADPATPLPIFAPADGTLFRIRHKTANAVFPSDDYDLFFAADCGAVFRFNHITAPRADLVAAYPAGALPSGDYLNGGPDVPERVVPRTAIKVRAGEALGHTTGTPVAHDWDYSVYAGGVAVCPFEPYDEPLAARFRALLGPKDGAPTPGYPCEVAAQGY